MQRFESRHGWRRRQWRRGAGRRRRRRCRRRGGGGGGGGGGSSTSCAGVVIQNDAALKALAESACTEIEGTLELTGDTLTTIRLPKLTRVSEALFIHDVDAATAIALPALTETGSLMIDGAATLVSLDLTSLAHVGRDLWLGSRTVVSRRMPALKAVKLPALHTVDGQLRIAEVEATEITAPLLESAGGLNISATFVSALALPKLTQLGGPLVIDQNRTLGTIDLGSVTSINGGLFVRGNARNATALEPHLDLHQLAGVEGRVDFAGNALHTIKLDALTDVSGAFALTANELIVLTMPLLAAVGGDLEIAHNRMLPTVLGFPSLGSIGGVIILGTRWDAGTCTVAAGREIPTPYSVALPALTIAHGLGLCDERGLTEVSAPKLPSTEFSVVVAAGGELESLRLDGLSEIGNRLVVIDNPELTTFTEALTNVKGRSPANPAVTVQRNPKLGCRGAALVAAAGNRGYAIGGNSATCVAP